MRPGSAALTKGAMTMGTNEHNHPHAEAAKARVREGVRRSKLTVDRFREPENKTALKHAAAIVKNDILGFFGEVRNILRQTEGLQSYANCKQNPTCSDAIEEYRVHIPPMYDEVLTDEPLKPTPGAATVSAVTSAVQAVGEVLSDAGSMEAFANRHQAYPGDPTKFDPNRPQSVLFKDVDDKIRKDTTVIETPGEGIEVLKDPNAKPLKSPVDAIAQAAGAVGDILADSESMQAFANRHQDFPGDPTKFDPNRPQAAFFKEVDENIKKKVSVTETPLTEEK